MKREYFVCKTRANFPWNFRRISESSEIIDENKETHINVANLADSVSADNSEKFKWVGEFSPNFDFDNDSINLCGSDDLEFESIHATLGNFFWENPEGEIVHVEQVVVENAKVVLKLIQNMGFSPPSLLIQECDEIMFTWQSDKLKFYLTVYEDEIGFIEYDKFTSNTREVEISREKSVDVDKIVKLFKTFENSR